MEALISNWLYPVKIIQFKINTELINSLINQETIVYPDGKTSLKMINSR